MVYFNRKVSEKVVLNLKTKSNKKVAPAFKSLEIGNVMYKDELKYDNTSYYLSEYPTLNDALVNINNWMPEVYKDHKHLDQIFQMRNAILKGLCYSLNVLLYHHILDEYNPAEEYKSYKPIWDKLTHFGLSDATGSGLGLGLIKDSKTGDWGINSFGGYEYKESLYVYEFNILQSEWMEDSVLEGKVQSLLQKLDDDILHDRGIKDNFYTQN